MIFLPLAIGTGIAATIILVFIILIFNQRFRHTRDNPQNVVVLYQVGRGPYAPSISPFPLKLETFLRMAKIPYMNDHTAKFSTKGKTPWMEYNGVHVADSQFCIEHLKTVLGVDLNKHLSAEQLGASRAFQKMVEENLYWTMCDEMFLTDDTTVIKNIIPYRGVKLWATLWFLRRIIRKETWGHGIGRHSKDEIWSIAVGDLRAISGYLGNKTYLNGEEPCEADCTLFGMLAMIVWHMPTSRHEKLIKEEMPNLVQYCERMKEKYWPDWNKCILTSAEYENDQGKIYNKDQIDNGAMKSNECENDQGKIYNGDHIDNGAFTSAECENGQGQYNKDQIDISAT